MNPRRENEPSFICRAWLQPPPQDDGTPDADRRSIGKIGHGRGKSRRSVFDFSASSHAAAMVIPD